MGPNELRAYTAQSAGRTHKDRVAALASRQFGQITWAQLEAIGVSDSTVCRWVAGGYLLRILPRVYAVGHRGNDEQSWLCSLSLFAGPDAALSHGTAAYRRGWLRYPVRAIHISTPRQIRRRLPNVVLHGRRSLDRQLVEGIPCTTQIQTLLDLAATEPLKLVKRSLAQLEYARDLDASAIREACGRGIPGSTALLRGLDTYMPELARTKSGLEDDFLYLCQRFNIPLPQVNVKVYGEELDCYWPAARFIAELDGGANHSTPAQRRRDHRKDMKLRAHGLTVFRYDPDQVNHHAAAVAAEVLREISS